MIFITMLIARRRGMRKKIVVASLTVVLFGLAGLAGLAWAGAKVYVGKRHETDRLLPLDQIDHGAWDRLLKKYVADDGLVDYAAWKNSPADRDALADYLETLGRGDPRAKTTAAGRLAFWINAYNAVTLQGILREYPTSSIRNHTAKVFGYNIWDDLLLRVASEDYSLNAIEHKVLRKLDEPRIHFAIVCASIGCPLLR
ncbi:hypothetical protein LCGC14_3021960, partial [marine sediment metagenome]